MSFRLKSVSCVECRTPFANTGCLNNHLKALHRKGDPLWQRALEARARVKRGKMNYNELTDEKLIEEAAKRLELTEAWKLLASTRITLPEKRQSMRSNLIKQLNLLDEYKVS